jgi:hypothetical protein
MVDSTEFYEVYNTTGEVLQNVPPTTPIVGYAMISVVLCVLLFSQKIKKYVGQKCQIS